MTSLCPPRPLATPPQLRWPRPVRALRAPHLLLLKALGNVLREQLTLGTFSHRAPGQAAGARSSPATRGAARPPRAARRPQGLTRARGLGWASRASAGFDGRQFSWAELSGAPPLRARLILFEADCVHISIIVYVAVCGFACVSSPEL